CGGMNQTAPSKSTIAISPPRKAHRSASRALSQKGISRMRSRIAQREIFDTDWCGPVQAANIRPPAIMAATAHRIIQTGSAIPDFYSESAERSGRIETARSADAAER